MRVNSTVCNELTPMKRKIFEEFADYLFVNPFLPPIGTVIKNIVGVALSVGRMRIGVHCAEESGTNVCRLRSDSSRCATVLETILYARAI